ncbi:MAG: hypothetical protein ACK4WH_09195 [Phycisphaerales bacterium]
MKKALAVMVLAGLASSASAQLSSFVLNDGSFRYSETTITGSGVRTGTGGGSSNFGFASGSGSTVTGDYLFQNWWWYRSAGDTREFALSNQTSGIQISPNTVALVYDEPVGGDPTAPGLRFSLVYTLNQISPTQAAVTINWNIENRSQQNQPVSFFSYSDSDIGSASDDSGSYFTTPGLNYHRNDASTSNTADFFTVAADLRLNDAWQAGNGFGSSRFGLSNSAVDNLTDATSPFVGDWAGAFQWNLTIPAGESLGGRVTKGYNYVIPAPGAFALLGLGGLVAGRRRRA